MWLGSVHEGNDVDIWVCLKMLCTPLYPMVLLIIIPIKWLFHWEYTLFSDKPICWCVWQAFPFRTGPFFVPIEISPWCGCKRHCKFQQQLLVFRQAIKTKAEEDVKAAKILGSKCHAKHQSKGLRLRILRSMRSILQIHPKKGKLVKWTEATEMDGNGPRCPRGAT